MGLARPVTKPEETQEHPPEGVEGLNELMHDNSGWPPHPSERRDLYHRIRCFPKEVVSWPKRLMRHVEENPDLFPAATRSGDQLSVRVDEGISFTMRGEQFEILMTV